MDDDTRAQTEAASARNDAKVDPGAAPGASDTGSHGRLVGEGLVGAGTGTSLGASRGNTGPGTGRDALEPEAGDEPPTHLTDMLGVGPAPGDSGPRPLTADEQAASAAAADPGPVAPQEDYRGRGDDDIPAETET